MKKEEVSQFLTDLLEGIQEQLKYDITQNQREKEDRFQEMKRIIGNISSYVDVYSSRALEEVGDYVISEERNALQRDDDFLSQIKQTVMKTIALYEGEDLNVEEVNAMTSRILQKVQESLIEKESKPVRNPNRIEGNDFFQDFEQEIEENMRKFGLGVQAGNEYVYDDIRNYLRNVIVNAEELASFEREGQKKILENLELYMQEAVRDFIAREEVAQENMVSDNITQAGMTPEGVIPETQNTSFQNPFQPKTIEISEEEKREMMARYRRGDFPLGTVNGKLYVIVSETQIDENGNVVKKGVRYTEAAFQDMFGENTEQKDIVTLVGKYNNSSMTNEEWTIIMNQAWEQALEQSQNKEQENSAQAVSEPKAISTEEQTPEKEERKELFTEEEKQQILLRIAKGELTLSEGIIPSYEIKKAVVDPETKAVKQPGIRLSGQAFVMYFSGRGEQALETKDYGHTICFMSPEEKERLEELERGGKEPTKKEPAKEEPAKAETSKRHRRDPNAYQRALEESGFDEIE